MEAKLTELVARLKAAIPDGLKTVVLYGSAVTGEFRAGHSDLNIVCVVDRADAALLEHSHGVADWWIRQGNPAPLFFTQDELRRSADVFAIELLDMKLHHRILLGTDFLAEFEVPLQLHRLQVCLLYTSPAKRVNFLNVIPGAAFHFVRKRFHEV